VSSMDVCAQKANSILKDPANQVESMEILSPPNFSGAMQDAVTQYWNNPNMSADAFIEKITSAMRDAG
jgi:glucose/mannose transport system substrate-binding protein